MEEQSERVKKFLSLVSNESSGWLEKAEQREKMREILKKHRKNYIIVESLIMKVMEEFGSLRYNEGKREERHDIIDQCGTIALKEGIVRGVDFCTKEFKCIIEDIWEEFSEMKRINKTDAKRILEKYHNTSLGDDINPNLENESESPVK